MMRLMKAFGLILLGILANCSREMHLKESPFEINTNTTVEDPKRWGFEVKSLDDGICVYTKDISRNVCMYFYLDFDDDCRKTTGQGIVIKLDTLGYHATFDEIVGNNEEKWFQRNRQEFRKDSLRIVELIEGYNGIIASHTKRLGGSTDLIFDVKSTIRNITVECRYTAYPQNQKTLHFELTWTNSGS